MTRPTSLLLAAFPPELAGLADAPPAGWRAACTGVGALAAAVTTTRLLAEATPERVLFVGTCGAYGPDLPVGALVWAARARTISLDLVEGRAIRPRIQEEDWPSTWTPALSFPSATVAVTPGVTQSLDGACRLGALADVEHLELTGVFAACHQAGVPCGAVLGVANQVGPQAHEQWKAHHAQVSRELIARLFEEGVFEPRI